MAQNFTTKIAGLMLGGLALSACSSGGDADKDGDGNITAEEAKNELASGGAIIMKPGEYEMKITFTELEAPGLPGATKDIMAREMTKGMTVKNCVTQEQIDNPSADMFGGQGDDTCKLDKFDRSGSSMTVAMTCTPPGGLKMVSSMKGSFAAESYTMDIEQKMTGMPTGDMSMKGRVEAKRVGDCPA